MSLSISDQTKTARSAPARSDQPLRGILLLIGSTVFLACSDAMAKYLGRTLPPAEVAWLRFTMFALILAPFILLNPSLLRSARPGLQTMRALAMLASSLFFITGLQFLPIAEASATAFVAPIFVTGLSVLLLSEKVGRRRWAATIAGLIGVFIMVMIRNGLNLMGVSPFWQGSAIGGIIIVALLVERLVSGRAQR